MHPVRLCCPSVQATANAFLPVFRQCCSLEELLSFFKVQLTLSALFLAQVVFPAGCANDDPVASAAGKCTRHQASAHGTAAGFCTLSTLPRTCFLRNPSSSGPCLTYGRCRLVSGTASLVCAHIHIHPPFTFVCIMYTYGLDLARFCVQQS